MRRTGQTFRKLLHALQLASEGKHVIYSCPSRDMARWTFEKALRIVTDFMEPDIEARKLLVRVDRGSVKFTGRLSEHMVHELVCSKSHRKIEDFPNYHPFVDMTVHVETGPL